VFPSLRYLEVHRFTPYDMDDQWNPAVRDIGVHESSMYIYFIKAHIPDSPAALQEA
jgi:hypothetical protein